MTQISDAMIDAEWEPTRWWRAIGPDGELWAESSDEQEIRELARPDDQLQQLMKRSEERWENRNNESKLGAKP